MFLRRSLHVAAGGTVYFDATRACSRSGGVGESRLANSLELRAKDESEVGNASVFLPAALYERIKNQAVHLERDISLTMLEADPPCLLASHHMRSKGLAAVRDSSGIDWSRTRAHARGQWGHKVQHGIPRHSLLRFARVDSDPTQNGYVLPRMGALVSYTAPRRCNVQNDFIGEWVTAGAASSARPSAGRDELGSRVRVLVADDYPDAAQSLALYLMTAGCETRIAYDGNQALAAAKVWQPQVCVLDLSMPKLDGCELARRVREHAWGKQCLLIALTGWTASMHKRNAQSAGFDCYLHKPVEPYELLRVIRKRSMTGMGERSHAHVAF